MASSLEVSAELHHLSASLTIAFPLGLLVAFTLGTVLSYEPIYDYLLKNSAGQVIGGIYMKAGEYGEAEQYSTWSPFKEPLNAWSSLAYALFGVVMMYIGISDYNPSERNEFNRLAASPEFSILYGISAIFLGVASCLFHASHSELWRKIDAGMTSGVVVPLFMIGIWDRARPIGVSIEHMVVFNLILQLSLTYGYLPYGSSDILLPTFVAIAWILELHPRYGGVVSPSQYTEWMRSFYAVLGGMLLRLADIKRKLPKFLLRTILAFYVITIFPFGYFLGFSDRVIIFGLLSGIFVALNPPRGHLMWHICSSFALYIWWYMLRTRPGDPKLPFSHDRSFYSFALFIAVKNAMRRIFMSLPFHNNEVRDRYFILLEHMFFTGIGYYVLVVEPRESMLFNPILCWTYPRFSSENFHLYYLLRISSIFEDVIFMAYKRMASKDDPLVRDVKMTFHHVSAGLLCLFSFLMGYENIGTLVIFLHDISDVPLACLRLAKAVHLKLLAYISYAMTIFAWLYWRLWYFSYYVIFSVAVHSKSLVYVTDCKVGSCTWSESPERAPFVLLLGTLFTLHILWFLELIRKGFDELRNPKETKGIEVYGEEKK